MSMSEPSEINTHDVIFPVVYTLGLLAIDLLIYGWIVPIFVLCFTAATGDSIYLDHGHEIIFLISGVSLLLYIMFYTGLEQKFWTRFFCMEQHFLFILQIRDIVNTFTIGYYLASLINSIQDVISVGMTEGRLTAGLGYFLVQDFDLKLLKYIDFDQFCQYEQTGSETEHFSSCYSSQDPIQCVMQVAYGAQLIYYITCFTASMIKLLYFNTTYSYRRAMNILIKMQAEDDYLSKI